MRTAEEHAIAFFHEYSLGGNHNDPIKTACVAVRKYFGLEKSADNQTILTSIWKHQGADLSLDKLTDEEAKFMNEWRLILGHNLIVINSQDPKYGFGRPYVSDFQFLRDLCEHEGFTRNTTFGELIDHFEKKYKVNLSRSGLDRAITRNIIDEREKD
ncbi:MAG: hypothetical protein KDD48_09295 [Bdellovibrionales bacterium]|nr:hypothetical protein [Bdellovibrionales bacterium]